MTRPNPDLISCPRCRRRVLEVTWDYQADFLFGMPRLDPVTLDQQQIVACVITGVPLWQLHRNARGLLTSHRTRWWPRRPIPGHIVPEHHCTRQWDAFPIDLTTTDTVTPAEAPF
ncbi:hypothetical protein [Microbacterium kunmingense]|uniref:hypothetical protein n=1 Tax=Microbacterium kunmingense TaxID=2915939 RepID=UPI003D71E250